MKKFLVYLLVIVVAVSLGFSVFYLVRDNERISLTTTSIYVKKGETFDVDLDWENKKAFSEYEVLSSNNSIVNPNADGTFTANEGGMAKITFRTSNAKYRNLTCTVLVGDGSPDNPYYISSPTQLMSIGNTIKVDNIVVNKEFTLDKCYQLIADINMSSGFNDTGYWLPIARDAKGTGFVGKIDGNGHSISNLNINIDAYNKEVENIQNIPEDQKKIGQTNVGFIGKVGVGGNVSGLTLNNINIKNENSKYDNIGAIAGESYGTIERCEVKDSTINVAESNNIGGIVGIMRSSEKDKTLETNTRSTARLDRSNANVNIGFAKTTPDTDKGASGNVGGLVGSNEGNIIVYSYVTGKVKLNDGVINYGGIVGNNTFHDFGDYGFNNKYMYQQNGGRIKDCYTNTELYLNAMSYEKVIEIKNKKSAINIGGIIGLNADTKLIADNAELTKENPTINRIIGNYYNRDNLNIAETMVSDDKDEIYEIKKDFPTGIGRNTEGDKVVSNENKEYVVLGKTLAELKNVTTYVSHVTYEYVVKEEGGEEQVESKVEWKFGTVWGLNSGLNSGLPYLNYDPSLKVSDEIYNVSDGISIKYADELKNVRIDGHYVLAQDINISEIDWSNYIIGRTQETAFRGSIESATRLNMDGTRSYFKIIGLKTQASIDPNDASMEQIANAALIGFADGSNGGYLKNITIENAYVLNGKTSATFVASNGFKTIVRNSDGTQTEGQRKGIDLIGCNAKGVTVQGTENVGGIVGINYDTANISGCGINHLLSKNGQDIQKSTILVLKTESNDSNIGGIAAKSFGLIDKSIVEGKSLISVMSISELKTNVMVGGIVGTNKGFVKNSTVSTSQGVNLDATLSGEIGGIAGQNHGGIERCIVNTSIIANTENDENVYAGGLAGTIGGKGYVSSCLVKASSINGYKAGGIAGEINYEGSYNMGDGFIVKDNSAKVIVNECVVDKDTVILGNLVGGIAGNVLNGYILNSTTAATLNGVNGSSIKAGISPYLSYSITGTEARGGFIERCYSVCNFATTNGENHGFTKSEILKDPWIKTSLFKRTSGFVANSAFANKGVTGNPKKPDTGNFLQDFADWWNSWADWGAIKNPAYSIDELKGTSGILPNILKEENKDVWHFAQNELPTIKSVNNLEEFISSNKITWNVNDAYTLDVIDNAYSDGPVENTKVSSIKNGGSFKFRLNLAEKYDTNKVVVKANGVEIKVSDAGIYTIDTVFKDYSITVENFVLKQFIVKLDDASSVYANIIVTIIKANENPETTGIIEYGDTVSVEVTLNEGYVAGEGGLQVYNGDTRIPPVEKTVNDKKVNYYEFVVNANAILSVKNVAKQQFTVTHEGLDEAQGVITYSNKVDYGTTDFTINIVAKEGYTLENVVVKANGVNLALLNGYVGEGKSFVIPGPIKENMLITVSGVENIKLKLTNNPANGLVEVIFNENKTEVVYGNNATFTLKLADGTEKKDNFKVLVNEVAITDVEGVYTIENVKENKNVVVEGVDYIEYDVTLAENIGVTVEIKNVQDEVTSKIIYNTNAKFTVALEAGYRKGANFKVLVNGTELTDVENVYTINNVKENQVIVIEGVEVITYTITTTIPTGITGVVAGADVTTGIETTITYNGSYTLSLTLEAGYQKGANFKVLVNGVEQTEDVENVYTINNVIENQVIVIEGVEVITYTITTTIPTGITGVVAGTDVTTGIETTITYNGSYTLTLTLEAGYQKGANFKVLVNGVEQTEDVENVYTINNVIENQVIVIEGIEVII